MAVLKYPRLREPCRKPRPTASALSRHEDLGLAAIFGWDQTSLVRAMPRLAATLPLLCYVLCRLTTTCRMRVLRARRQRGVQRGHRAFIPFESTSQVSALSDLGSKCGSLSQKQADERLGVRWPTRDLLLCDPQRRAIGVAKITVCQ